MMIQQLHKRKNLLYSWLFGITLVVSCRPGVLIVHSLGDGNADPPAKVLDGSGFMAFWQVYQTLRSDQMPSQKQWDTLWSTEAYRYLDEREDIKPFLEKWFVLCYMPSKESEFQSAYDELLGYYRIKVDHFRRVLDAEEDLHAYVEKTLGDESLWPRVVARAETLLPEGSTDKRPPRICLALFEPDGKASGDLIVVDALFCMNIELEGFLAHEAHHYYTAGVSRLHVPDRDAPDYPVVRAINQLRLEGIADLLDKSHIISEGPGAGNWYEEHYATYYAESPVRFQRIDSCIQRFVNHPKQGEILEGVWQKLPFGAHPNGLYMARVIKEELGIEPLLESLRNPFHFFYAYQEVAKKRDDYFAFSSETEAFFRALEEKYIQ